MINEVSPPGWGHTKAEKEKSKPEKPKSKIGGTAHAMQKAQKRGDIPKDMNIFALMWSMKNKGDKPHYKPGVKGKLKGKYKGPEGQNEMIDPKKIRNYKNVSNAVVAKADKEAEKVKDKEQKGTLEFPQMPTEESKWSDNFKKQSNKRRGETRRRQQAQAHSPGQRVTPPKKDENILLAPKGKGKKAAKALYQGEDIDMVSLVAQAIKKLPEAESDWAKQKRIDKEVSDRLVAQNVEREKRYQAQQAAKKQAAAKKEEVEVDEWGDTSILSKQRAKIAGRPDTPKKEVSITKKGEKALKKGDQKLSITKKGIAAIKDDVSPADQKLFNTIDKLTPKSLRPKVMKSRGRGEKIADDVEMGEGTPTPKFKPLKHKVWSADASIPAGARPKDPGKIPKYKVKKSGMASGPPTNEYVTHFGDVLRQAITEAKKVNAIDTINKIVKTKTMGKLHGQQVDLFTASAIQAVYNALNKKNQEKMTSVMSKDVHGLLKMADFSMKQMKRR